MNLKRAYLLLCGFYTLLILIGVIALLMGGGSLLAMIQLGVGAVVVIGLWGYFLDRGFMNPRMWRPLAGLLALGIVVQMVAVFTADLSSAALTWTLTTAIFSVLPMIFLYRYGDRDQPLWASPEEREGGKVLGELLEGQPELMVEKQAEDSQATVRVRKAGDGYLASVEREREGEVEAFEERFRCPATLAFFIEKFTCISVGDFATKYRAGDTRPA
ncbi:hypothetical protein [Halomonas rhizosphaerae]|uniref:Uncharacterized protein n=1 Tax=Halomonas rhizosphaerae TaxID=3043296 RepID=A0ABT6UXX1_9GAMM|nr:hypothetical protein [Halomonas rhizosphaerae]MDI5889834.1 hypothetical protein [Halomonas rhizosphaerae]MDI5919364.1 hypothetical protein [Halomonas rhizosphaerae]